LQQSAKKMTKRFSKTYANNGRLLLLLLGLLKMTLAFHLEKCLSLGRRRFSPGEYECLYCKMVEISVME